MDTEKYIAASDIEVEFNGVKLNLHVDMSVGIGGHKWPAADSFCQFVACDRWQSFFHELLDHKTIIELGSGNGMAGILIDKLFQPERVVITDLLSHVALIDTNISVNNATRSKAIDFDWFNPPELGKFDVVLGFECVYREDLYRPFVNSLLSCCHKDSHVFIGLTRAFATPKFFSVLGECFVYTMLPTEALGQSNDSSLAQFVLQPLQSLFV